MQKNSYNYDELISCAEGKLFGEGNAKLPLPPMLMFDRITEIKKDAGEFNKGFIKAEAISTLCLVGLKPDDLNFLKISIFFTFFSKFLLVYNHSKTQIYMKLLLNQVKQFLNHAKKQLQL